ncbi:uncharacterized protein DS421_20g683920 [Arachis hypogaea]|nr:uncharacterized protein DS421_20g683920 [Arachis hypogaea]
MSSDCFIRGTHSSYSSAHVSDCLANLVYLHHRISGSQEQRRWVSQQQRRTSWWWLEICDWEALVGLAGEECVLGSGTAGGRRGSLSSGAGKRNRIGVMARVRREVSLDSIRVGWVFGLFPGLVFGAGFALANRVLGPKPPTVNVTAPPPPADNVTAAPALQQVDGDPCSLRAITKLLDCINSSKDEKAINKCQVYMDRLVACRKDHLSRSAGPVPRPAPVHQAPAPAPAQSDDGSMHDDAAAAAPVPTANSMDACSIHSKAFQDCINSYGSDISKCQFYMDKFAECRKNSGAPMSALNVL